MSGTVTLLIPSPGGPEKKHAVAPPGGAVVVDDAGLLAGTQARDARRAVAESTHDKVGGPRCVQADTTVAAQAIHDVIPIGDPARVVDCSDGAARAYELLGTRTLRGFADLAAREEFETLSTIIRTALEEEANSLRGRGFEVHVGIVTDALAPSSVTTSAATMDEW